jgi:hypothetical protein
VTPSAQLETPPARAGRGRRVRRIALGVVCTLFAAALGLRLAAHSVPWVGASGADVLRRVIGARAVTRLEETTAALDDWWHRVRHPHQSPRALVEVERGPAPAPSEAQVQPKSELPLRPTDIGPMDPRVAAAGDGSWRAVPNPNRPEDEPILFATMLHPDVKRSWAEVFVVAAELERVRLHAVAGSVEPKATTPDGQAAPRPAVVPEEDQQALLAVFNGGFKTEHGQHGMYVDGVTLLPAKSGLCTIACFADGRVLVGTWDSLSNTIASGTRHVLFWRQAAPCLVERGALNAALRDEQTRRWGATIDGETVIRRSALGLDAGGRFLYVAITNDTTATALATAMLHAGASDVAQLDVNWSYPKFVLFPRDASGALHAQTLFEGFPIDQDSFVRKPYPRDFFYVTLGSREPSLP